RLEQSIQHRKDLLQRQREETEATERQLAEIEAHIANDQIELAQIDQVLEELGPTLAEAHARQRAAPEELERAEGAMERWRERWSQAAEAFAAAERQTHVESARLEQLTAQLDRLDKERQKLASERAVLRLAEREERGATLAGEEERLLGACEDASRALNTVWQEIRDVREQEARISSEHDEARVTLTNDKGRLASLVALQEAALGQSAAHVSTWLEEHGLAERNRLAQELVVEPGWELAVETVLGAYLQAVTVDDLDRAAAGVTSLEGGGLTLLESGAGNARPAPAAGSPLDHVQGPPAAFGLLAGVFAAESLADAIAMRSKLADGESVVTRDGYWVGRQWLRIRRSDDPQVGVLARGEEIKRLKVAVEEGGAKVEALARALADARARLEALEDAQVRAQAEEIGRAHV